MAENRRKSENIRRANRVIQTRTFVLMLVLGVAVFLVLALKLYQLQIKQHDYYQSPQHCGDGLTRHHLRPQRQRTGGIGHGGDGVPLSQGTGGGAGKA